MAVSRGGERRRDRIHFPPLSFLFFSFLFFSFLLLSCRPSLSPLLKSHLPSSHLLFSSHAFLSTFPKLTTAYFDCAPGFIRRREKRGFLALTLLTRDGLNPGNLIFRCRRLSITLGRIDTERGATNVGKVEVHSQCGKAGRKLRTLRSLRCVALRCVARADDRKTYFGSLPSCCKSSGLNSCEGCSPARRQRDR